MKKYIAFELDIPHGADDDDEALLNLINAVATKLSDQLYPIPCVISWLSGRNINYSVFVHRIFTGKWEFTDMPVEVKNAAQN